MRPADLSKEMNEKIQERFNKLASPTMGDAERITREVFEEYAEHFDPIEWDFETLRRKQEE